jgi:hypothetical protein
VQQVGAELTSPVCCRQYGSYPGTGLEKIQWRSRRGRLLARRESILDHDFRVARHPGGNVFRLDAAGWQGSLPEFRGPVCQQSDGGGFGVVGGLDNELFAVGADVVADPGEVWQIELKKRFNGVDVETGLCTKVCGHEAVSHGDEEEFLATAENRVPSAGSGDLGFCAGSKRHDVDFGPAGFIGEISQPAAIGREASVVLADRHVRGGGRLEELAVAGQRHNPIGKDSVSRFQIEGKVFPIWRPVDGRAIDISVVLIENFFGLATVERAEEDRVLAIFTGTVGYLLSIGRPYGPKIIGAEGDARELAACEGKYPDIVCTGSWIGDGNRDGFTIGRKTRIRINSRRTGRGDQVSVSVK